MKGIRAALVALALAGAMTVSSATAASAHTPKKTQAFKGTAQCTDHVSVDGSCKEFHVVGSGTAVLNGQRDTYSVDACSWTIKNRNGSTSYGIFGQYDLHVSDGTIVGEIRGTSKLTPQNTLRHKFNVTIIGGDGKYNFAQGKVRVNGTGTYDYSNGVTINDIVNVAGSITLAS